MKMNLEAYHDYLLQLRANVPEDKVTTVRKAKPSPKTIVKKRIPKTFRKK